MDAIKATFCNFKNIAGRKVVQLIFEIICLLNEDAT